MRCRTRGLLGCVGFTSRYMMCLSTGWLSGLVLDGGYNFSMYTFFIFAVSIIYQGMLPMKTESRFSVEKND